MSHTSVTRRKKYVSSNNRWKVRHFTGIDRLEFALGKEVHVNRFIAECEKRDIQTKMWNDGKSFYVSTHKTFNIGLKIWSQYTKTSKTCICNPTHFDNFQELISCLKELLGEDAISPDACIYRLDFAVNVPIKFKELRSLIDVKYKRSVRLYSSGTTTGFQFGNAENKVVIYDYDKKHKTYRSETRIEIRLQGRKQIVGRLKDLNKIPLLMADPENHIFKHVQINPIELKPLEDVSPSDCCKYSSVKTAFELNGYSVTKKHFNKNRNFKRDYEKFFIFRNLDFNLDNMIIESLEGYFLYE